MDAKQEKVAEITGLSPDTVEALLKDFHNSRAKTVVQGLIKVAIEERRTKIESCSENDLTQLQGEIKGMRIVLGSLDTGIPKEVR